MSKVPESMIQVAIRVGGCCKAEEVEEVEGGWGVGEQHPPRVSISDVAAAVEPPPSTMVIAENRVRDVILNAGEDQL